MVASSTAASSPAPGPESSACPSPTTARSLSDAEAESEGEEFEDEQAVDVQKAKAILLDDTLNHTSSGRVLRLQALLEQSAVFSNVIAERFEENKRKYLTEPTKPGQKRKNAGATKGSSKKRKVGEDEAARVPDKAAPEEHLEMHIPQPKLVTGATLRDYQLAGVSWMASLWMNGLNGILADEMGLGKTLQTIAFLAYLKESDVWGPFAVVCPKSVLHNWIEEFKRFAPDMPVCMYHGTPDERAELRRTALRMPSDLDEDVRPRKKKPGRRKSRATTPEDDDDEPQTKATFPVIVTTYDIVLRDSEYLREIHWKYIVVDEGHRLKNMDCKLVREIKTYPSANRLILTGTPLHNNLAELWSLLNFILPDIFDDLEAFQEWFDSPESTGDSTLAAHSSNIVTHLHGILKPFLLRRLKTDVETSLPPKKEYVLYAPLTEAQRVMYDAALGGTLRSYLIGQKIKEPEVKSPERKGKVKRKRSDVNYHIEDDDETYFDTLENEDDQRMTTRRGKPLLDLGQDFQNKAAVKQINNLKLQNVIMQLRKVCSHPFLFDWPVDSQTRQPVINDQLINASGKMLLLNRLLEALFAKGHRVLLFSQFTTMLDIIEDWAIEFKKWNVCRIDGQTSLDDRRDQMNTFNAGPGKGNINLFLLSTRAGGLGLNLVSADTVIFYDQDWNPQMDLQAQDRAHRIGQTKPVLIFRLVTAHTVEKTIMQKASKKRELEALVIAKGKFRRPGKTDTRADAASTLLKLEGEEIEIVTKDDKIISDRDLEVLLDRSPEVFSGRAKGWVRKVNKDVEQGEVEKNLAFEVFEQEADEGDSRMTQMMGESVD